VPETAVDYTLYGDSVYLLTEKKEEDGKTKLTVSRTFVQTQPYRGTRGNPERVEGRRPRRGRRPAQAAIGIGGDDLERPGAPIPAKRRAIDM